MKSDKPERKRSLKLKIADDNNFKLFGISSHENDYRLVWAINNQLSVNFTREPDFVIHQAKLGTDLEFSRFLYSEEEKILTYYLISNRCPNGFLLPEMTNIDYLLQIIGEIDAKQVDIILKKYRKVDIVSAIFKIDLKHLKGGGALFTV